MTDYLVSQDCKQIACTQLLCSPIPVADIANQSQHSSPLSSHRLLSHTAPWKIPPSSQRAHAHGNLLTKLQTFDLWIGIAMEGVQQAGETQLGGNQGGSLRC